MIASTHLSEDQVQFIRTHLRMTEMTPGVVAEAGVNKGGSLKKIHAIVRSEFRESESNKEVIGYDSYDNKERYGNVEYEDVRDLLRSTTDIQLRKEKFPPKHNKVYFAFVHMDLDDYDSILDSLKFLKTAMNLRGRVVVNGWDKDNGNNARLAVLDFLQDENYAWRIVETNDNHQIALEKFA